MGAGCGVGWVRALWLGRGSSGDLAALVPVRVSHSTAGGRAHLNVGLPEIQCFIQMLLCQEGLSKAEMMVLAPAAMIGFIFPPSCPSLLLVASPHFGPVPPEMGCGYLLQVLGPHRSVWGLLGAGSFWGGYYFLAEGPGSLQLRLIIMRPN